MIQDSRAARSRTSTKLGLQPVLPNGLRRRLAYFVGDLYAAIRRRRPESSPGTPGWPRTGGAGEPAPKEAENAWTLPGACAEEQSCRPERCSASGAYTGEGSSARLVAGSLRRGRKDRPTRRAAPPQSASAMCSCPLAAAPHAADTAFGCGLPGATASCPVNADGPAEPENCCCTPVSWLNGLM